MKVLRRVEVIVHNKKNTGDGTVQGEKQHLRRGRKKSQQRKGRVNGVEGRKLGKYNVISTGSNALEKSSKNLKGFIRFNKCGHQWARSLRNVQMERKGVKLK